MNVLPSKLHWLDKAIQVYNFHVKQCKDEKGWTVSKTAESLNRSLGSVSQDILLADWSRSYERQMRKLNMKEALQFIKGKRNEIRKEIN